MINTNEEYYTHRHYTVLKHSADGIVVELSIRSRYHEEPLMEVLREAEDKIKVIFKEKYDGYPKPPQ